VPTVIAAIAAMLSTAISYGGMCTVMDILVCPAIAGWLAVLSDPLTRELPA